MGNTNLGTLTAGLSLEQKRQLSVPLAAAYANALSNVGMDELKDIAKDKAWSIFVGYFGVVGTVYEMATAYVRGEAGDFKEKLAEHFLEYAGLDQFKEAYDILQKMDNGRAAMALAKDPAFKSVIGKQA